MKIIYLLGLLFLVSCGDGRMSELADISKHYQNETHLYSQAQSSNQNDTQTKSINESSNESISDKSQKSLICEVKQYAQQLNSEIINERREFIILHQKLNNSQLSVTEKVRMTELLIKYRLLGSLKYLYTSSRFSATEIAEKVKKSAKKHVSTKDLPKKCVYTIPVGRKQFDTATKDLASDNCLEEFLKRAQIIFPSMAVAQATLESGWGKSRFAKQGNNLYGLQYRFSDVNETYKRSRCMAAEKDPNRCLYKFDNRLGSVKEYYRFLNAGTYQPHFRQARGSDNLNPNTSCLDAAEMAQGLTNYAENSKYIIDVTDRLDLICHEYNNCN